LYDEIYFNNKSNIHHCNFIRQQEVLKNVLRVIEVQPEQILREMSNLVNKLTKINNVFCYIGAELEKLKNFYGKNLYTVSKLFNWEDTKFAVSNRFEINSEHYYRKSFRDKRHVIFGLEGSQSCYLLQGIYYNNTNWSDKEIAEVRVMLQYLSDRMYDKIRGSGLTYGVTMSLSVTEGRITLSLSRTSRLAEAYRLVREILTSHITNKGQWDSELLNSARGSLIYTWTEKEETTENLLNQAVKAYLRKTDTKYNRSFVESVAKTATEKIKEKAADLLSDFFNERNSHTAIVCNPTLIEEIRKQFHGFDINLSIINPLNQGA